MCAEYTVQASARKIQDHLGKPLLKEEQTIRFPERIKFTNLAPVVTQGPCLVEKFFPAVPFPNARLSGVEGPESTDQDVRRIYDVPLWKKSFAEHPALVPMTAFFEPVYWGKQIGTVQKFAVPDTDVFFVAGMLIKPGKPARAGLDGFTLLTHTATDQMMQYHQRLVTILKPEIALKYLQPMSPQERFDFLIENRYTGELSVEKDRNMAKGWEKRIAQQEAKLHREEAYRSALKREGTGG